jgi:hypothetical protein
VAFKVPTPDQLAASEPVTADAGSGILRASVVTNGAKPAAKKELEIEFLCPNGHRLHGPASMQGRPGQCPECGSKFRIPSYVDEISDEETLEQGIGVGPASDLGEEEPADEDSSLPQDETTADEELDGDLEELEEEEPEGETPREATPAGSHGWGDLFGELWALRAAGAVVVVCFKDGETIAPEHFANDPGGQHAIFAAKGNNGIYTLTAVTWDSVTRVLVRGLKILPRSIFGE